jgi:hypothetical protein
MILKLLIVKEGISICIRKAIVLVASQIARKLVSSVSTDDTICNETRGSSVGMLSRICCSIPDRGKGIFSSLRGSLCLRSPTGIILLNGHRERLFPGIRRQGSKIDYSLLSIVEFTNGWIYTSTPHTHPGRARSQFKP